MDNTFSDGSGTEGISIGPLRNGEAEQCERLLRSLPDWFGIEQSILDYRKAIERFDTAVARSAEKLVGFITVRIHTRFAAEIVVMAVAREFQHRGVGRALVAHAETKLAGNSIEYLQVKTLGPSHQDDSYGMTRRFYSSLGFRPLEETQAFWGKANPCLIMVKRLAFSVS